MKEGILLMVMTASVLWGCKGSIANEYEKYYDLIEKLPVSATEEAPPSLETGAERIAQEHPSVSNNNQVLFLPVGSRLDYPVLTEGRTVLRAELVALRGAKTRLRITLETDNDGVREVAAISGPRRGMEVPLPLENGGPLILRLEVSGAGSEGSDGVLLRAPALWRLKSVSMPEPVPRPSKPRPNIVFYLIDTLRRDHLGCYGYPRPTSPNIDAFSETSTLFVDAVAQSSWTKASIASVFTGLWPPDHGATQWQKPLVEDRDALAELLKAVGYRTAGIVANVHLVEKFGFAQGFDDYIEALARQKNGPLRPFSSSEINDVAFDWIDKNGSEGPFFLYLHTFDPHDPYEPPIEFGERFRPGRPLGTERGLLPIQVKSSLGIRRFSIGVKGPSPKNPNQEWPLEAIPQLRALYDGEIAWNDDSFGKLVAYLKEKELYDDSLIIVASDHGDEFHEHGHFRHGYNLHAETLNIPLIIKLPRQRIGRVVTDTVQHTDLLPTILEYVGAEPPPGLDGRSLLSTIEGTSEPSSTRRILSFKNVFSPPHLSVIVGDWKLLVAQTQDGRTAWTRLFNRARDPGEIWDVAAQNPVRTAVLESILSEGLSRREDADSVTEIELDEELTDTMRALGYLR